MLRFHPGLAGGLAVISAAVAATVFTLVTATHPVAATKADRLPANVSVAVKNPAPPEATVRGAAESQVERAPIENIRAPAGDKPPPKEGCESGLSPDISPTVPVAKSRCLVQLKPQSELASLR